jgi:phosphatidylethanolamine/phosphatidyl-N-methylethanolamine N-methyltransferase
MSLQSSYRIIAPFYDFFLGRSTANARRRSLSRLPQQGTTRVLLSGAGTGLDFQFLHTGHHYTSLDLTSSMLARAQKKSGKLHMDSVQGDSMSLPFGDASFDYVVLHLILAVVAHPERCLQEAERVLKPGGRILIFDKFLQGGERAWIRRGLNLVVKRIATRLDVVFEEVLSSTPDLRVVSDEAALAGGWFRLIELMKKA